MIESRVPSYKLFGETELWPTPEPVHYETIAERSALYGWEIAPHSHDSLIQITFLEEGEVRMVFETEVFELLTPCLVMVPARHIHGFRFSRRCRRARADLATVVARRIACTFR